MPEKTLERALAERALELLRQKLPPAWTADFVERSGGDGDADLTLTVEASNTSSRQSVLVEVKKGFKPADLDALLGGLGRRLRTAAGSAPILLVTDYLSPRSRDILTAEDIGYVDLAGNIRIVLDYPGLFIETVGIDRRPTTSPPALTLRGAKAARLIRFLVDVSPPYGVVEIESATALSRGYVSRLLELLVDEALIQRKPRGRVAAVDWQALLRRRAQEVDLLKTNTAFSFIASNGARAVLEGMPQAQLAVDLVVTGSFAAYRLAPVAAPTLLALYSKSQSATVQSALGLLPAQEGGDVVVLRPPNDIALEGPEEADGVLYAAPSQVAIDCLSGPGRMPAEGDAVIEWMTANEAVWRTPDIGTYMRTREQARRG